MINQYPNITSPQAKPLTIDDFPALASFKQPQLFLALTSLSQSTDPISGPATYILHCLLYFSSEADLLQMFQSLPKESWKPGSPTPEELAKITFEEKVDREPPDPFKYQLAALAFMCHV